MEWKRHCLWGTVYFSSVATKVNTIVYDTEVSILCQKPIRQATTIPYMEKVNLFGGKLPKPFSLFGHVSHYHTCVLNIDIFLECKIRSKSLAHIHFSA